MSKNALLPEQIALAVDNLDFVLAYRFLMRMWGKTEAETWQTYRLRVEELEQEHLGRMEQARMSFALCAIAA